jgi:hypothetical protein
MLLVADLAGATDKIFFVKNKGQPQLDLFSTVLSTVGWIQSDGLNSGGNAGFWALMKRERERVSGKTDV